ncbi:hypothetical protein AAJ76_810001698 [Vairimorpha ceranae]|uniref:Uncharacterized protein n=1 Tax=Vairimorpha ceranae TaxID=40302 RepID=A0A0F9WBW6_9MICR|nr:hypothetical protein AAJ76_810001698 [Vairimorpha ceranae]KKO74340.1 hypothetical protein AAJ76_810001698 [Vairimorpha ceranae]
MATDGRLRRFPRFFVFKGCMFYFKLFKLFSIFHLKFYTALVYDQKFYRK